MKVLAQIAILVLGVTAMAWAHLDIVPEQTIVLPNVHGKVRVFRFQDITSDNIPEIAFGDDSAVTVYSITADSVIWRIPISYDTLNAYDLLFDDCNRDSIPDLVIVGWGRPYSWPEQQHCSILLFDGASSLTHLESVEFYGPYYEPWMLWCDNDIGVARIEDLNGDGYNELLFSYHKTSGLNSNPLYQQSTAGQTLLYYSFPDSLQWSSDIYPNVIAQPYMWNDSSSNLFVEISNVVAENLSEETCITNRRFGFLDSVGQFLQIPTFDTTCNANGCSALSYAALLCSGDLITGDSASELLFQSVYITPDSVMEDVYIQSTERTCYREAANHTLEKLWSHISTQKYQQGMYFSQYPGFYFVMFQGELLMFRGTTEAIFQRAALPTTGKLSWASVYPDSSARLLTTQDSTIEVYRIDASTPVAERPKDALPVTFQLKTPYPNPFNPVVTIPIDVPRKMNLSVTAYNVLGQKVETIFHGKKAVGQYRITWDAGKYPSGIYFISVSGDGEKQSKKITLIK